MLDHAPHLSLVIPLLDEAESLPALADRIRAVLDPAGRSFEVWMIDDGSTDGSWEVIRRLHREDPRFAGIRLRKNYGKSAALAVGFERTRGRYVVTLDADLQDDPAEIPEMIERLEGGADLVSGWKQKRHDPLSKTIPSRFFNGATRLVSGIPLHDFNCGLKAYRAEVVKHVRVYGELHRYIPLLAKWEGYDRIEEQVVQHHKREYGETKFGLERFVRGFLDLITVVFVTRFGRRPMHFFGGLGMLSFLGGFAISLSLSIGWMTGTPIANRPLFFLGIMLVILGVQLFLAGFLGEMIVRPQMERTDTVHLREVVVPAARAEARVAETVEPGA